MPRYHVRVVPSNGKPPLYLSRRHNDFHEGPFTTEYRTRLTFGRPNGADKRIAIEMGRLPNQYYGDLTFEVVEEPDRATCTHCGATILNEANRAGQATWVDQDGNDLCGWGVGDEPHEPA